jgi:hypothetical protein
MGLSGTVGITAPYATQVPPEPGESPMDPPYRPVEEPPLPPVESPGAPVSDPILVPSPVTV